MLRIPAYSHVLVDIAYWRTKELSDQEPVIAIRDQTTPLPPYPRPLIHAKLPRGFFD